MVTGNGGTTTVKGTWTAAEDAALRALVGERGAQNWSEIAAGIPGRTGKSCRLRWCNRLNPDVHHRPFTPEEDDVIMRQHALVGNKWAAIARLLRGRSDKAVKNHFNSSLRRISDDVASSEGGSGVTREQSSEKRSDGPEEKITLDLMPLEGEGLGAMRSSVECGDDPDQDDQNHLKRPFFMMDMQSFIAREVRNYIDGLVVGDGPVLGSKN